MLDLRGGVEGRDELGVLAVDCCWGVLKPDCTADAAAELDASLCCCLGGWGVTWCMPAAAVGATAAADSGACCAAAILCRSGAEADLWGKGANTAHRPGDEREAA